MDQSNPVQLAYDISVNSYDLVTKRFDAFDARIQTILGVGVSITLAAPIVFSSLRLSMSDSPWFVIAICLFIVATSLGTYARLSGELTLLAPRVLYEKWLGFSEAEFKRNLIFFAGKHMEMNTNVIKRKHVLLVFVTLSFFLEVAFLVLAALRASPFPP